MKKYPRTYHLSFSPEVHSDDKVCDMNDVQKLIDDKTPVVITEKLDGGCTKLSPTGVFARSVSQKASCPSFNYIKNVHFFPNINEIEDHKLNVFGENLFAIHSIEYSNLTDYFYVFNILHTVEREYMDLRNMMDWVEAHSMCMVPIFYVGEIPSMKWLEECLSEEINEPSELGGEREGFVIRNANAFHEDDFHKNVFKYVRKGHVQTDQHWSKNWKAAKLNKIC